MSVQAVCCFLSVVASQNVGRKMNFVLNVLSNNTFSCYIKAKQCGEVTGLTRITECDVRVQTVQLVWTQFVKHYLKKHRLLLSK